MPHWTSKSANIVATLITVIGSTQIAGYLTGSRELRAIGLATVAAPLEALWTAVFCYGLKLGEPLRRELGLPDGVRKLSVEIRTTTRGRTGTWMLSPECAQ